MMRGGILSRGKEAILARKTRHAQPIVPFFREMDTNTLLAIVEHLQKSYFVLNIP
jgi:hypothetical protein